MLASVTTLPVVGVPVALDRLDGLDSLLSIVQMPRGVPVATVAVNGAANAGLLALRILVGLQTRPADRARWPPTGLGSWPTRPGSPGRGAGASGVTGVAGGATVTSMSTLAERLRCPADAKLLIINADDFGCCHSANVGIFDCLRTGLVTSATLMVPCPWAREAAARYRGEDVGVHLTVNAEWELYRWGPITHAPSLVGGDGGFPRTTEDVWEHADLDEVRREWRAQIERAILWGFDVSHIDRSPATLEAYQFVFGSRYTPASPELAAYALHSFASGRPMLEGVLDLTARIHRDFVYDPRATTVATPLKEVFAKRRGVCQDFAHLELACLRSLGLAARYVSGYLCTNPGQGQRRLLGADATHAWLSVWCPRLGWVDVDPTNDLVPSDKHILLAWGRDYDDVSPIKGVILGGGQHVVQVGVEVTRMDQPEESQ